MYELFYLKVSNYSNPQIFCGEVAQSFLFGGSVSSQLIA